MHQLRDRWRSLRWTTPFLVLAHLCNLWPPPLPTICRPDEPFDTVLEKNLAEIATDLKKLSPSSSSPFFLPSALRGASAKSAAATPNPLPATGPGVLGSQGWHPRENRVMKCHEAVCSTK